MRAFQLERWLWVAAVAAVLIHPAAYLGMFAGDAEIHLVYGRAAASGHLFEFNPGEKTPGVTSPGYMLALMALFRLMPENVVPLAVKVIDVLFWYGSLGLVALLMAHVTSNRRLVGLAVLLAGLLPGSAYNATTGMESGLFAFSVLLTVVCAIRLHWFDSIPDASVVGDVAIGVLLGCACWLRPEGFVVAALFHLVRWWQALVERASLSVVLRRSIVSCVPLVVLVGALLLFHHSETGYWVPGSGRARILAGQLDSWQIGPILVYWKPLRLLALYAPLSFFWLLGCWWVARNRLRSSHRPALVLAALMTLSFFCLYSIVLGAAHLGRYLVFVMPFVVVIAVLAAGQVWATWPRVTSRDAALKASVFGLFAVALAVVMAAEVVQRRALGEQTELRNAMHATADRARFSDHMESLLGHPDKRPIVLAVQEVDRRYWLDDRFVVRSLDGRTDPALLRYAAGGNIDHVSYLRDRSVDFLLETPNYNRDRTAWSLSRLESLKVGEVTHVDGLSFLRLAGDPKGWTYIYRVERDDRARTAD